MSSRTILPTTSLTLLLLLLLAWATTPSTSDFLHDLAVKSGHDHEHKCPEKCYVGKGAWKMAKKSCVETKRRPKQCDHDDHKHDCKLKKCKKAMKMGWKCTCDCAGCDTAKKCPDKCFTGMGSWKMAKKSCMTSKPMPKMCDHDDHEHACAVKGCKMGKKKGYKCTCVH